VEPHLADATREALLTCTMTPVVGEWPDTVRRITPATLRPGVRYRFLLPDHVRVTPMRAWLAYLADAGARIRTVPDVPVNSVVIDGCRVVLPRSTGGVSVIGIESVVTASVGVFEHLWQAATPFVAREMPDQAGLTARERTVLHLLAIGCADEAIAARLGVSVRTVRRLVSGVMNRLGARSRFQAGAKAAGRGWLAGHRHTSGARVPAGVGHRPG
jgi:DNA-binding CsgD family transcriptional regulator